MRTRAFGLTVVALMAVGCGETRSPSPSAPSTLSQPANIADDSAHETGTFLYRLGPAGNKATAENGDVVTVSVTNNGTNTFNVAAKSATGGGTFVHKTSGGTVLGSGTWAASGLLVFQSYGTAPPFPPNFFGGRAALKIVLTPTANPSVHLPAILQMECLVGNPPGGATEGIRLNVQDVINFNATVEGGIPPFIKQ
jgi:hypothetical protein